MSLTVMTVEVSAIHLLIQEAFIEHLLHARSSARCRTPFKELTVSMRHSSAPDHTTFQPMAPGLREWGQAATLASPDGELKQDPGA